MALIKSMEVLFLGTGSSHTLPFLECTSEPDQACAACLRALQPEGERNIRGHTSCAVKVCFEDGSTKGLLIDCGMNTMQNAAKWFPQYGFKIDAVILTHEHIDAIGGIPLLAQMRTTEDIPVYGNATTLAQVRQNFSFIFKDERFGTISRNATLDLRELELDVHADICGIPVLPLPVHHGRISEAEPYISYGYLIASDLTVINDCHLIPESTWSLLDKHLTKPPDVFILECLALKPAPAHYSFPQAISAAARLGAKRTYLTQLSHGVSHEQMESCCEAVQKGQQPQYPRSAKAACQSPKATSRVKRWEGEL